MTQPYTGSATSHRNNVLVSGTAHLFTGPLHFKILLPGASFYTILQYITIFYTSSHADSFLMFLCNVSPAGVIMRARSVSGIPAYTLVQAA